MSIGAKHVALVALVALVVTYAAFSGKSASSDDKSVSVAGGRKALVEPQEDSTLLTEESTTTSEGSCLS